MKDANHVKHGEKKGGKQWKNGGTLSWKPSKHEAKTRSKKLGTIPWTLGTRPTPRQYLSFVAWEVFSGLCINGNVCVSKCILYPHRKMQNPQFSCAITVQYLCFVVPSISPQSPVSHFFVPLAPNAWTFAQIHFVAYPSAPGTP